MPINIVSQVREFFDFRIETISEAAERLSNEDLDHATARCALLADFAPYYIASILDHSALSEEKLQSILDNTNITIQAAQKVVDVMSNPTKIGTGGRRGYLGDDWWDNKLTLRDRATKLPTTFNKIFSYFRPEWSVQQGNPTATNHRLEFSDRAERVSTMSNFTAGKWRIEVYNDGTDTNDGYIIRFMVIDDDNFYCVYVDANSAGDTYKLKKIKDGAETDLISLSWGGLTGWHTHEIVRDENGNFEIFLDGASKGTATDEDITSSNEIRLSGKDDATGAVTLYMKNLEVY